MSQGGMYVNGMVSGTQMPTPHGVEEENAPAGSWCAGRRAVGSESIGGILIYMHTWEGIHCHPTACLVPPLSRQDKHGVKASHPNLINPTGITHAACLSMSGDLPKNIMHDLLESHREETRRSLGVTLIQFLRKKPESPGV